MPKITGKRGIDYIGVGVGAVIINSKNEILLLLRKKPPEADYWTIPGGAVEWFETCEDALIRECREEIGAKVKIVKLLTVVDHIVRDEGIHWISSEYLVKLMSPVKISNFEKTESQKMKWFPISHLPEKITLTTREAVKHYLIYRAYYSK